jgi:hypothetical protein
MGLSQFCANQSALRSALLLMSRNKILVVAISLLVASGFILYARHLKQMRAEARSQLLQVRQTLLDANTKSDVDRMFVPSQYPLLGMHKTSGSEWVVMTPFEFGANNWDLYLEFQGATLSEMRVRLGDSKSMRPDLAPPDIRKE